jgi:hypothetical protein
MSFRIESGAESLAITNDLFRLVFTEEAAGFPASLGFAGEKHELLSQASPLLTAKRNGKPIRPSLRGNFKPEVRKHADHLEVLFDNIAWEDDKGEFLDGYRLALRYELFPDGVAFAKTFFYTETETPGKISAFRLSPHMNLSAKEEANWAYWSFPADGPSAADIQAFTSFERNLARQDFRRAENTIHPYVSFDFGSGSRRDRHLEWFVESWCSLTPDYKNTETDIRWRNRTATVDWTFQKKPVLVAGRPYQWENTWGWAIRRFPVERRQPPLRIYHYLDNFQRYPSDKLIGQVAEEGANVFILHESWRLLMRDGTFPYDVKELKRTIRSCHRRGLRVMLYVRGNEDGIVEDFGCHLAPFLKHNYDGVYMDYGSARSFTNKEEYSPGGRIHFRQFDLKTRRVRDFVGEDGLFISHSGSGFSAVGHTVLDAYLGGEQEKGLLIQNQTLHSYFSGVSVAPSSLWTGAFPTYRTRKMLPFLATTSQMPFLHAGTQMHSCSLDHPHAPSTLTFARPLWKLWQIFDGRRDIRVYSSQSTDGIFSTDNADTGVSLWADRLGNVLLIVSNFRDKSCEVKTTVDWEKLGLAPGKTCHRLHAGEMECAAERDSTQSAFTATLEGYGITGWLIAETSSGWAAALKRFVNPYPTHPATEKAHTKKIAHLRQTRFETTPWRETFLRVWVQNYPNNYEDALWWDLFENVVELRDLTRKERLLGYVGAEGFGKTPPKREKLLWPGIVSPWIPLSKLLKEAGGTHRLGLCTKRMQDVKNEFYNFVKAELSPVAGVTGETRSIEYNNDIDLDWSRLTFDICFG